MAKRLSARFVLTEETRALMIYGRDTTKHDYRVVYPAFLVVLSDDEAIFEKQVLQMQKSMNLRRLIGLKKVRFVQNSVVSAAAAQYEFHSKTRAAAGPVEAVLYKRHEDPTRLVYVQQKFFVEVMTMEAALQFRQVFTNCGAHKIRSTVARSDKKSAGREDAVKIDVANNGLGGGRTQTSAEATADAFYWNCTNTRPTQRCFLDDDQDKFFVEQFDKLRGKGMLMQVLQDCASNGFPTVHDLGLHLTHTANDEQADKWEAKVAVAVGGGLDATRGRMHSTEVSLSREVTVTFWQEEDFLVPAEETLALRVISLEVTRTRTLVAKVLKVRKKNGISNRCHANVLVVGEKGSGKTTTIYSMLRAWSGYMGYADNDVNAEPQEGMQIRVPAGVTEVYEEGTDTSSIDRYLVTEVPYKSLHGREYTGMLFLNDTEGLEVGKLLKTTDFEPVVARWTEMASKGLDPPMPQVMPDATLLLFNGADLHRLIGHDVASATRILEQYRRTIAAMHEIIPKHPVMVLLTRGDMVPERSQTKVEAFVRGVFDEDIAVGVAFIENYVPPTREEIVEVNQQQEDAQRGVKTSRKAFTERTATWKAKNDHLLSVLRGTLANVSKSTYNEFHETTAQAPCVLM